jgi:protoheme IX farnesyltransferase
MEATITDSKLNIGRIVATYRELMKIRIVALLVFTTITAMFVAANGVPDPALLMVTALGGTLAAGGASALNQYIDRDMDGKMARTARRPIPSGRVAPVNALVFGAGLVAWAVLILGVFVNWLAAFLALLGAVYYVVLYTMLLKRNTVANIVIGGGAGAIPVLVGWAAVTNTLAVEAFVLFAIVFYWTPPHSWALALLVNKDYAAANVPMMPVARGEEVTRWQILYYSVQLVLITLIPSVGLLMQQEPMLGVFYAVSALVLGGGLLYVCVKLIRVADKHMARVVYKYSSMYLALLFMAMIVDRLL